MIHKNEVNNLKNISQIAFFNLISGQPTDTYFLIRQHKMSNASFLAGTGNVT